MNFLALSDLKEKNKEEVIQHLINTYSGEDSGFDYGEINEADKEKAKELLSDKDLLLAYEEYESYEGSAFFIFKSKLNDDYFELHGGHCSCYGFEGQLKDIEKTTLKALKDRASKDDLLYSESHASIINEFILSL